MGDHTPGPWTADRDHDVVDAEGYGIASVHGDADYIEEANARLIAAAPDPLAALMGAIGALEINRDYHSDLGNEDQALCQDKLDAARRAIALATGAA